MNKRIALAAAVVALTSGCASDDWTRADTLAELSWQTLNVIDAKQTADIQYYPTLVEVDPLSRKVLGRNPGTAETYQLLATYAISHYVISRSLPPRWRKYWHVGTITSKALVVDSNRENRKQAKEPLVIPPIIVGDFN